jgi:hypothetical protein
MIAVISGAKAINARHLPLIWMPMAIVSHITPRASGMDAAIPKQQRKKKK